MDAPCVPYDLAAERGFTMLEHPRVALAEEAAVPKRSIQVVADLANAQTAETTQVMYDYATGRPVPVDTDFLSRARDYIGG